MDREQPNQATAVPYNPDLETAVFLGPSLDHRTARAILPANYYPPARMGDVYRLLATNTRRILLIDGVFHGVAAIWQRELLSALDNGISVVGAASMGALRAVELAPYGMRGIGAVFNWYRDGHIQDDGEVALLHGDASMGFRPLTLPLVNVRHNLQRAFDQGVLNQKAKTKILAAAQNISFLERTWRAVFEAAEGDVGDGQLQALASFTREHGRDLKADDARQALEFCASTPAPHQLDPLPIARAQDSPYYDKITASYRGFYHRGTLYPGKLLLDQIRTSQSETRLRNALIKDFYLNQWAGLPPEDAPTAPPPPHIPNLDTDTWRAANGWSRQAFQTALNQAQHLERRLEEVLHSSDYNTYSKACSRLTGQNKIKNPLKDHDPLYTWVLGNWARQSGLIADADLEQQRASPAWQNAFGKNPPAPEVESILLAFSKLVSTNPDRLGYPNWSLPLAVLQDWQWRGEAARQAARL